MSSENCRVCGQPLFVEKSKKRGIGPVCWARIQKETEENDKKVGSG